MLNVKKLLMAAAIVIGSASTANSAAYNQPDMYVVMFRADWCGACKYVEPTLQQARHIVGDSKIEFINFDTTDPTRSERSAYKALERGITPQFNGWSGVTGFAMIIDADTKRTLGCVGARNDSNSMALAIRNYKSYALSNTPKVADGCPAPNYAIR